MRRRVLLVLALAFGLTASMLGAARADLGTAKCATTPSAGGDWPGYGHDLSNTRNQDQETTIGTANAGNLKAKWTFSASSIGDTGPFQSTPIIAEGCVYMTTGSGFIYALNADSGQLVWHGHYASQTVSGVCCGSTMFAPVVHDGVLYENISSNPSTAADHFGPYVVALNSQTGDLLWKSASLADDAGSYGNASGVYFDGMLFVGITGPEGGLTNTGGFAILDAATGSVLKRTHSVSDEMLAKGYGGGSIWSTAAIDTTTRYAFAGTGQPATTPKEDPHTNAILKIDLAKARDALGNAIESDEITNPRFGEIVDSYKGTPDDFVEGVNGQITCQQINSSACVHDDVDFAASPTLFHDSAGREIVAENQKSGWLHAAYTDGMEEAWSTRVAPFGTALGNYSSTATDGHNVFGAGAFPGLIASIQGDLGGYNWAMPAPTYLGANPVSYANGVVYYADGKGVFNAYDASTGQPLVARPMSVDAGGACTNEGGGVAIARHTVFAVCGEQAGAGSAAVGPSDAPTGWLIAYAL